VHQLAAEAEYVDELREDRRQEQRTRRTRSSADEPPTQRG
jgi:hypothetical protein